MTDTALTDNLGEIKLILQECGAAEIRVIHLARCTHTHLRLLLGDHYMRMPITDGVILITHFPTTHEPPRIRYSETREEVINDG